MGPITKETKLQRLVGRLVDPLPAPLATAVAVPVLVAEALAMFGAWFMPRRLPDLRRFIASADFAAIQSGSADWTRALYALIEDQAPWLRPAGRSTADSCALKVALEFEVRLPVLGVQCDRRVVGVYGADGTITDRLASLGAILATAGCGEFSFPTVPRSGKLVSGPSPAFARWRDPMRAGSDDEDDDATPPAGITLHRGVEVGWASREQPYGPVDSLGRRLRNGEREPPAKANRIVRPVETAYTDDLELAARALADCEHVIVIALRHCYYMNLDIRRYPLPRSLIPRTAVPPFAFFSGRSR